MLVSFITMVGNSDLGWDVVRKSFPAKDAYVVAQDRLEHYNDQKDAEASAKKIALSCDLTYVPENLGVIIIAPHFGFYMPKLLTPEGRVKEQGTKTGDIEEAIAEARNKAEKDNFVFIPPKPFLLKH